MGVVIYEHGQWWLEAIHGIAWPLEGCREGDLIAHACAHHQSVVSQVLKVMLIRYSTAAERGGRERTNASDEWGAVEKEANNMRNGMRYDMT